MQIIPFENLFYLHDEMKKKLQELGKSMLHSANVISCSSASEFDYLEKIFQELRLPYFKYWQSKYNKSVLYEYEPVYGEGSFSTFIIYGGNIGKVRFAEYLILRYFNEIDRIKTAFEGGQNDKNSNEING